MSCQLIVGLVAAASLLAMLLWAEPAAAQEGWTTAVSKESKLERGQSRNPHPHEITKSERIFAGVPFDMPPPKVMPVVTAPVAPLPASATAVKAPPGARPGAPRGQASGDTSEITTGSIDTAGSTNMLSPTDSARLFAPKDAATGDITTGAVDGQGSDLSRGYCANISGAAADARIALQKMKLAEAEREVSKRIATLEAKTAEYKAWVERRDEFLKRASTALVKIYAQMEPDAAAQQLVAMDEETAAAILIRAEPGTASAILNEMPPEKAARLAAGISGAARLASRASVAAAAAAGAAPAPAPARPTPAGPKQANPGEAR